MIDEDDQLFGDEFPSAPRPDVGKVLVSGATGYIGGRLVPVLIDRGYDVRVMVRAGSPEYAQRWPRAEVVVADALDPESLRAAMSGVKVAYFLIHSLLLGHGNLEAVEVQTAFNFRRAAEQQRVERIIYLGGLGDAQTELSRHLRTRIEVANELSKGPIPVTILRAAIIIGSGSASYEIIYNLVKRLPALPIPAWARTRCQPIGVRDVIKYLVGVLENDAASGRSFDIGGQDVLTYEKMMHIQAEVLARKRWFPRSPVSSIRLFAYLASLLTPVPNSIAWCLMEGIVNEVVCKDTAIREIVPFEPLTYKQALLNAMSRGEQDRIHSRWSDAYPPAHELAIKLHELKEPPEFMTRHSLVTHKSARSLFRSICRIGGRQGWFHSNWLWRLRGILDRLFMGVGTSRGRRQASELRINDVIDFWRVEDMVADSMLLLRAEMKLPGLAWLWFGLEPEGDKNRLSVTACFHTESLWGKAYWYACLPFHNFIFQNLLEQIEKRS